MDQSLRDSIQTSVKTFEHAISCIASNCDMKNCAKLKLAVWHVKNCQKNQRFKKCRICKQITKLYLFHAKQCKTSNCKIWLCPEIRQRQQKFNKVMNFSKCQVNPETVLNFMHKFHEAYGNSTVKKHLLKELAQNLNLLQVVKQLVKRKNAEFSVKFFNQCEINANEMKISESKTNEMPMKATILSKVNEEISDDSSIDRQYLLISS